MNNFMIFDEKREETESETKPDIISVPWENDNFSLHLDTTFSPPHILKRLTKQYVPPQISSPLRHQWRVSQDNPHSSKLIEDDFVLPHHEDDTASEQHSGAKKKLFTKKPKPEMTISTDVFPYSNSSNLFVNIEGSSLKSPAPSISSRSRVEHVSPLLNSPVLQFDDILPFKHESQISESWRYTAPSIASSHHDPYRTGSSPSVASYLSVSPSLASEYRSIAVPKNADNLIIYSSDTSIYDSTDRPYSHYFNPAFKKPKKRSTSLLRKIMNNIKHRFVAAK